MFSQKNDNAYLKWIELAEGAVKMRDYETAARFYRHVAVHFGLLNDLDQMKRFTVKTGECYLNAGESLIDSKPVMALQFFIKASNCFREGRDEQKAKECDSMIERLYNSLLEDGTIRSCKDVHGLKRIGDYFASRDVGKATICYETAAKKAFENGKPALSGSLYGTLGECYVTLRRYEDAARRYALSAEIYYECRELFEAAWRYCISGFYFILAGNKREASLMARKAESACKEDRIDVLLNDLALICRLLSEGGISEAKKRWIKIRRKFKESYIRIIDSCFRSVNLSEKTDG